LKNYNFTREKKKKRGEDLRQPVKRIGAAPAKWGGGGGGGGWGGGGGGGGGGVRGGGGSGIRQHASGAVPGGKTLIKRRDSCPRKVLKR